jgi:hypothetical protein
MAKPPLGQIIPMEKDMPFRIVWENNKIGLRMVLDKCE